MKKLIVIILLFLIVGLGAFLLGSKSKSNLGVYSPGGPNVFNAPDSASGHSNLWVSSTAYGISKNASRTYFRIASFPYSTSTVWVWQATSTDLVATGKGIPLNSSSSASIYEIDYDNLYKGEIQLISEGDTRVSWFEK